MVKALLSVTGACEAAIGLTLIVAPSMVASLLLGVPLDTSAALTVARVAGSALLALGLVCWLARDDGQSSATRGLIAAILLYNVAVIAILAHARIGLDLSGIGFWPTVAIHAALAVRCVASRPTPDRTAVYDRH
jgi:hypothetical protein